MRDFERYLQRVGVLGGHKPRWQELHRAHTVSIPFENLDPHCHVPISLKQDDIERKLVDERRGGYCFEQNLLFASVLEHLGLQVDPMLARVRIGGDEQERPLGHLLLRVTDEVGQQWHADVGFGGAIPLLDPIPFGPSGSHRQGGSEVRVVEDQDELVLQVAGHEGWTDVYGFRPVPAKHVDIEVSNWWMCTQPASRFVLGLLVSINTENGVRHVLSDFSGATEALTIFPDGRREVEQVSRVAIPTKLRDVYGLPGFATEGTGRIVAVV